jgi:hypothetical protein
MNWTPTETFGLVALMVLGLCALPTCSGEIRLPVLTHHCDTGESG